MWVTNTPRTPKGAPCVCAEQEELQKALATQNCSFTTRIAEGLECHRNHFSDVCWVLNVYDTNRPRRDT